MFNIFGSVAMGFILGAGVILLWITHDIEGPWN